MSRLQRSFGYVKSTTDHGQAIFKWSTEYPKIECEFLSTGKNHWDQFAQSIMPQFDVNSKM
jgi:hypothetical protein